jgi:hypothetical protein
MLISLITISVAALVPGHETPILARPEAPALNLIQETLANSQQPDSRIHYTYLELGYSKTTLDGYYEGNDVEVEMQGGVGSLELTPYIHIFVGGGRSSSATVKNVSVEGGKIDNWFAGVGIHQYITPELNGFLRVSVAGFALQADNPAINIAGHDTVYSGGVRYFAWEAWELGASISRAEAPNADLVYEASALYRLTESLGLGVIYNKPDRGDTISIGARWYF